MVDDVATLKAKTKPTNVATDPLSPFFSIGEAVATLLHPYAEVVLHDLRTGRIVRIWNSFTERQAGDLSHLKGAQDVFPESQGVLGPYEKALTSQGRTKSITAGLRDDEERLIGFLCINLDVTVLDIASTALAAFASSDIKRPEPIYRNDVQQHISYLARDFSIKLNKPMDKLSQDEKIQFLALVDRDGLFQARNSVISVAKAMKVSRATVYNLLRKSSLAIEDVAEAPEPPAPARKARTKTAG